MTFIIYDDYYYLFMTFMIQVRKMMQHWLLILQTNCGAHVVRDQLKNLMETTQVDVFLFNHRNALN